MPPQSRPVALPRLVPVPRVDPPYDDETAGPPARRPPATDGALALAPGPGPFAPEAVRGRPGGRRLRALAQAVAEVLAGTRPAATVADRFTDRAHAELVRAGKMIDTRRPPRVGLPHTGRPRDGVIEMCVLVHCDDRDHVLALRLERRGVQWLCTEFETA